MIHSTVRSYMNFYSNRKKRKSYINTFAVYIGRNLRQVDYIKMMKSLGFIYFLMEFLALGLMGSRVKLRNSF